MFATTVVFDTQREPYANFRIPVLCVTAHGTVLCSAEARQDRSDWGEIHLLMRRSLDGGRTFQPAQNIGEYTGDWRPENWDTPEKPANRKLGFNNCVFIADRDGTVHLLYCVEYSRILYRRSADDGISWSPARDITATFEPLRQNGAYPWKVVATGPGHGIQTSKGRLIVPCWMARGSQDPNSDQHRPSIVTSLYSDDGGESWHAGDIVATETGAFPNMSETIAVELPDGRILFNIRSEAPERLRALSYSADGATGWTTPELHPDLFEPICHAGLIRAGDDLLFSNPHTPTAQEPVPDNRRKNLVVRLSRDGGQTWPLAKTIEPGLAGYSDLGVLPDGSFLCFYEIASNPEDPWILNQQILARFDREWLEAV